MGLRVIICSTCAAPGTHPQGADFAETLRAQVPTDVNVELTDCMNMCGTPLSLALRDPARDTYLFSGIDPAKDLADTLALVRLYQEAEDGTITDARPAGRLRHCLVGRVPK